MRVSNGLVRQTTITVRNRRALHVAVTGYVTEGDTICRDKTYRVRTFVDATSNACGAREQRGPEGRRALGRAAQ